MNEPELAEQFLREHTLASVFVLNGDQGEMVLEMSADQVEFTDWEALALMGDPGATLA